MGILATLLLFAIVGRAGFGSGKTVFTQDGWSGNMLIGTEATDPYTRAYIARNGLLALSQKEAIYFSRNKDETGERLSETCVYKLSGGEFPARWWSVTLYAHDNFLAVNNDGRPSINASMMGAAQRSGQWNATISPQNHGGAPWVSSKAGGEFMLLLRLYNPDDGIVADPAQIEFPHIKRVSCETSDA